MKSSVTGTFAVAIYQTDGNDIIGSTYTINSADTWEKKEITFAGNTLAAIVDDNTNAIMIDWFLAAGSNFTSVNNTSWGGYETGKLAFGHGTNAVATTTNATWEITGVQWELGEQATPFEHRSFADELARCQRYAYMIGDPVNSGQTDIVNNGIVIGTANGFIAIPFPCTMRAEPSLTVNNATYFRLHSTSGGSKAVTGVAIESGETTERMALINATSSGLTAGQGTLMITSDSSSNGGTILFSAEL